MYNNQSEIIKKIRPIVNDISKNPNNIMFVRFINVMLSVVAKNKNDVETKTAYDILSQIHEMYYNDRIRFEKLAKTMSIPTKNCFDTFLQ